MILENSFIILLSITVVHITESIWKQSDSGNPLKVVPSSYSSNIGYSYLNWDFNLKFEFYHKHERKINENFLNYLAGFKDPSYPDIVWILT